MAKKHQEMQPSPWLVSSAGLVGGLVAAVVGLLICASNPQNATATALVVGPGGYVTIGAAVQAASPGDTILIHAGTYLEQVTINKQLTIASYGDGEVVIDGQCSRAHGFLVTNDTPTANPVGVSLRGMTVQNTTSASVMFALDRPDSPRPGQGTVDGMTLKNFQCQGPPDGNQYHAAVSVYYGTSGFRITNNTIVGPTGFHASADGIWFKSNDNLPSGGGHYIAGNTISNVWDGLGGEEESSAHGSFDGNTIIENNTVTRCYDDGLNVEGGDDNVIVRNNNVSGCGTGIAFAAPITGPLYIENNYIHDLILGDYDNLFCFKVGNNGGGTTYLTENICDVDSSSEATQGAGADGIHQTNEGLSPIVSRHNIFQVSAYVFILPEYPLPPGTSLDEDCVFTTDPERFIKWSGGVYYSSLAELQAAGEEPNGRQTTDCSFLGTPTPLSSLTPPPRTTPGLARETAAGQPPDGPRPSPDSASSSGGGSGGPGTPLVIALGALAGLILLGLGFVGGVRWSGRDRQGL